VPQPCNINGGYIQPLYFPVRPPGEVLNSDLITIMQILRADIKHDNLIKNKVLLQIDKCNNPN